MIRRHRFIDMWSWTEMLTVSFQPRAKTVTEFRFVWVQKIYRLREGHNWCPLECRLFVGKPFPRRPRKWCRLETQTCQLCHLQCTCFSNQTVPWQNRVLCDLKPKLCIFYFHFCEWRSSGWYLSFWWGMVVSRVEKSKVLMLVIRLKFGHLRCSNNSFENMIFLTKSNMKDISLIV